jgi:hypothetical protein
LDFILLHGLGFTGIYSKWHGRFLLYFGVIFVRLVKISGTVNWFLRF